MRIIDGADAHAAGSPSFLCWLGVSISMETGSILLVLHHNQEESHHAKMSAAIYKINMGLQQGHSEDARHTCIPSPSTHIQEDNQRTHLQLQAMPAFTSVINQKVSAG